MERKSRNQILKEVKERLSTQNYFEIHKLRSLPSTEKIIILGNKRIDEKKVYELYEKIIELQKDEYFEYKALGVLADQEYYNSLDDSLKQKYILDLSRLYMALVDEIRSKQN